jgi:hypothetical protein
MRAIESRWMQETRSRAMVQVGGGDAVRAHWEAQPWRRQLQDLRAYERRVPRAALVEALLAEGCSVEADVARFAGSGEERETLGIGQVMRYAASLRERMTRAGSDDEMLQLSYLRHHAEQLAERMIDWANTGHLPA